MMQMYIFFSLLQRNSSLYINYCDSLFYHTNIFWIILIYNIEIATLYDLKKVKQPVTSLTLVYLTRLSKGWLPSLDLFAVKPPMDFTDFE